MMVFVVRWTNHDDPFGTDDLSAVFSTIEKADAYVKSEAKRCNFTLSKVENFFENTLDYSFTTEWGTGEVTIEGFEVDEIPYTIIGITKEDNGAD